MCLYSYNIKPFVCDKDIVVYKLLKVHDNEFKTPYQGTSVSVDEVIKANGTLPEIPLDYSNNNGYGSKYTNNNTCNRELKTLYPWLREVDKFAISNAIYNLDNASKRYMNKLGGKPKFKKKNKGE